MAFKLILLSVVAALGILSLPVQAAAITSREDVTREVYVSPFPLSCVRPF